MEARRVAGYEQPLLRPAPALTPLQRFLYSSNSQDEFSFSRIANPQANHNGVQRVGRFKSTVQAPRLSAPSSGYLLGESSLFGAFVGGQDQQEGINNQRKQKVVAENSAPVKNVVKGQWTSDEDSLLVLLVKHYGVRKWSQIAKQLVGRIGKQCRERWHNHLRPDIKKDHWTEDEEILLVEAHMRFGNRWAEIAKHIPGRSENSIKNHWNATKRRQDAKRKPRRRTAAAAKAERARPSILQEYIRRTTSNGGLSIQQPPVEAAPPDLAGVAQNQNFLQNVSEQTLMAADDQGVSTKGLILQETPLVGPIYSSNLESFDNYLLPAGVGQSMIMKPSLNPNNLMTNSALSYPSVLSNNTSINAHSFGSTSSSSNSSQLGVDNYLSYLLQGGASLSRVAAAPNYMPIPETTTAMPINISDMDLLELMSLQFPSAQGSSNNFMSSGRHYNYY